MVYKPTKKYHFYTSFLLSGAVSLLLLCGFLVALLFGQEFTLEILIVIVSPWLISPIFAMKSLFQDVFTVEFKDNAIVIFEKLYKRETIICAEHIERYNYPLFGKTYSFENSNHSINQKMFSKEQFKEIENLINTMVPTEIIEEIILQKEDFNFDVIDDTYLVEEKRIKPNEKGIYWLEVPRDGINSYHIIKNYFIIALFVFLFIMFVGIYFIGEGKDPLVLYISMIITSFSVTMITILPYWYERLFVGRTQNKLYIKTLFSNKNDTVVNIINIENKLLIKGVPLNISEENIFDKEQFNTYIRPLIPYIQVKESADEWFGKQIDKFTDRFRV
jgi:hypothetical protein